MNNKTQQGSDVSNITQPDLQNDDNELWQPADNSAEDNKKKHAAQPLRPLTKKRKAFVKAYATNKQTTMGEAAIEAGYKAKSKAVASQIASELLKKPEIKTELAKYESKAEHNLMVLADKSTEYALEGGRDGAAYASVSEKVNNSIIDRLRGKATQRTEVTSKAVTLNIDLTHAVDNPVDNYPITDKKTVDKSDPTPR